MAPSSLMSLLVSVLIVRWTMYGQAPADVTASVEWQQKLAHHHQRAARLLADRGRDDDQDDDDQSSAPSNPSLPIHAFSKRITAPPTPPAPTAATTKHPRSSLFDRMMAAANSKGNENQQDNNNTHTSKKRRKATSSSSRSLSAQSSRQYHLDFGQSPLGVEECSECGSVYQRGDLDDERRHRDRHDRHVHGFPFDGWRNEPLVRMTISGSHSDRILRINHNNVKGREQSVKAWLERLHAELGGHYHNLDSQSLIGNDEYLYIYVRDRRVVALMTVKEHVQSQAINPSSPTPTLDTHSSVTISPLGIERVWVLRQWRYQGIATSMLEAACLCHYTGMMLERSEVAFSQPTSDGRQLARSFTGLDAFQAYA